jgi:hypothetical protein
MKSRLIKYRRLHPLTVVKPFFSRASSENEPKRKIFRRNPLKLSMKANSILAIAIIVIMLVSVFAFLPKGNQSTPNPPQSSDSPIASPNGTPKSNSSQTGQPNAVSQITSILSGIGENLAQAVSPKAPGTIESAQTMNSSVWRQVAANAWRYFQPGEGVDPNTGLPRAGGTDSPNFTDWDLGVYIQAIIDANTTGLIGTDGAWNSSARLETVVSFLETRELNSTINYPYWFYQAKDGKDYRANSDLATSPVDIIDTGRLFVALNNLRLFNSSLASRINNIVLFGQLYNRSDYATLVPSIYTDSQSSTSIYAYYIYSGFASFWPNELSSAPSTILNNILSSGNVTTPEGVSLPISSILGDPLLCSVFDLNNNNSQLMAITRQVYLAHEAYYNATGQYRAFSEGASLSNHWTYEWVVLPDNRTWVILDEHGADFNISPIIYTKIAMGFLAIYNSTYARGMVVYLERSLPDPSKGYCEGVDESGVQLTGVGSNTNGLIIGAAKYAIQNNP